MGHFDGATDVESAHRLKRCCPNWKKVVSSCGRIADEARYFRQTEGYRCLGFAAANLGQDQEAQRLAKQSIALAEQSGTPFLKLDGLLVLAQ